MDFTTAVKIITDKYGRCSPETLAPMKEAAFEATLPPEQYEALHVVMTGMRKLLAPK